jgi:hypothetical protein
MIRTELLTRRLTLVFLAGAALTPFAARADRPQISVHKDPGCGCCDGWVEHLQANGFSVHVIETYGLNRVKARLGVPADLAACHTAEMGSYLLEGHVPAEAIEKLLREQPKARGLAVPGMPAGSPGMGGEPEDYEVILFGGDGNRVFGKYRGDKAV